MDEKYNGWTNYETWNVKLWMDNEQSDSEYWRNRAQIALNEAQPDTYRTKEDEAIYNLSEELKEAINDGMPDIQGTYADLLNAAVSMVNWHEIAESLIKEVAESIKETK